MITNIEITPNFWQKFHNFMEPSIQYEPNRLTLESIPDRVSQLIELIRTCDEPSGFFDFGPYVTHVESSNSHNQNQIIAASALISHRYELLRLTNDLLSSWIISIEHNQLTTSALLSRAMTEFGADLARDTDLLKDYVSGLTHKDFLSECADFDSGFFKLLYKMRYAGRLIDYQDSELKQNNLLGAIAKLPDWIKASYDELSEICHPNSQATAIYWSMNNPSTSNLSRIKYVDNLQQSQTPFKIQVAAGPYIIATTLVHLSKYFWSLALSISEALNHIRDEDRQFISLPTISGRNNPCFCNSGLKLKDCVHRGFFRQNGAH